MFDMARFQSGSLSSIGKLGLRILHHVRSVLGVLVIAEFGGESESERVGVRVGRGGWCR